MPRTQTNDGQPIYSSFIVRLATKTGISAGNLLFRNQQTAVALVVTCMDLMHVGAASGDNCYIGLNATRPGIFGAQTGAGLYDTFSWRGQLALASGEGIYCGAVSGPWDFTASGYYCPQPYSFPTS